MQKYGVLITTQKKPNKQIVIGHLARSCHWNIWNHQVQIGTTPWEKPSSRKTIPNVIPKTQKTLQYKRRDYTKKYFLCATHLPSTGALFLQKRAHPAGLGLPTAGTPIKQLRAWESGCLEMTWFVDHVDSFRRKWTETPTVWLEEGQVMLVLIAAVLINETPKC